MAALEQLVDVTREKRDASASRFAVVLRQTRPLLYSLSFQPLLLKLVGDKEEVQVAKEIQKALKQAPSDPFLVPAARSDQWHLPPTC